ARAGRGGGARACDGRAGGRGGGPPEAHARQQWDGHAADTFTVHSASWSWFGHDAFGSICTADTSQRPCASETSSSYASVYWTPRGSCAWTTASTERPSEDQ